MWIWRAIPEWGDSLIDYILLVPNALANSPNTIRGGLAGVRFWHLMVGMPDFKAVGWVGDTTMCSKAIGAIAV